MTSPTYTWTKGQLEHFAAWMFCCGAVAGFVAALGLQAMGVL